MEILLGVLLILTVVATFFTIPYSKAKNTFNKVSEQQALLAGQPEATFELADLTGLPLPVQKYFTYCEYLGKSKMQIMKAVYKDVNFKFGKNKPTLKIDYVQYNFVNEPARIAYIDSTFYGIPFEGLDSFIAGKGSMTGIIAKLFTLFSQTGEAMDEASLVTFLSESLLIPNAALQEYITWCEIDNLHAEATISYYGKTVSGIFAFKENGELISFTTSDRKATSTDGINQDTKWSVVFGDYKETGGIKQPTAFQAIWHYADGDLLYFDAKNVVVEFRAQA